MGWNGFKYVSITCPHCCRMESYQLASANGCEKPVSCRFCHNTIWIKFDMSGEICGTR